MKVIDFLSKLRKLNIRVSVKGDRLNIKAPAGTLDAVLKQEFKALKPELLAFLKSKQPNSVPRKRTFRFNKEVRADEQALYALSQLDQSLKFFHCIDRIRVTRSIDFESLQRALETLFRSQLMLRIGYRRDGSKLERLISKPLRTEIIRFALKPNSETDSEAFLQQKCLELCQKPFDLSKPPLVHFSLIELGLQEYVLVVVGHRMLFDLKSLRYLLEKWLVHHDSAPLSEDQIKDHFLDQAERFNSADHLLKSVSIEAVEKSAAFYREAKHPLKWTFGAKAKRHWNSGVHSFVISTERPNLKEKHPNFSRIDLLFASAVLATLRRYSARVRSFFSFNSDQFEFLKTMQSLPFARLEQGVILPFNCNKEGSVQQFYKDLHNSLEDIKQSPYVPPTHLLSRYGTAAELMHHPLFQVGFHWQTAHDPGQSYPFHTTLLLNHQILDVEFFATDHGDRVTLTCVFREDVFPESVAQTLVEDLESLLKILDQNAESTQKWISSKNVGHLRGISQIKGKEIDLDDMPSLWSRFQEWVEKSPDAIAVDSEQGQVSYAELGSFVETLCWRMAQEGVKSGDWIGLAIDRGLLSIVALWASIRMGTPFYSLDPEHSVLQLKELANAFETGLILTSSYEVKAAMSPTFKVSLLDSDNLRSDLKESKPVPLADQNDLSRPISAVFSPVLRQNISATVIRYGAILNRMNWLSTSFPLEAEDVTVFKYRLSFSTVFNELVWPLIQGAQIFVCPLETDNSVEGIAQALADRKVCAVHTSPLYLRKLLEQPAFRKLNSLKYFFANAEPLSRAAADQFFLNFPETQLINIYSLNELGGDALFSRITPGSLKNHPLGEPLPNIEAVVLDDAGEMVPIHHNGHLHLAGQKDWIVSQVSADQKRNRLFEKNKQNYFKTFSSVSFQDDGSIEYHRAKRTHLSYKGFRIDYENIESLVRAHSDVTDCCLVRIDSHELDQRFVIYFVAPGASLSLSDELAQHMNVFLPVDLRPLDYIQVESLPDEDHLETLVLEDFVTEGGYLNQMPRTFSKVERLIADLWCRVLNVEKVGLYDDFFELGGTIYQLLLVFEALPDILRNELKFMDLFNHTTVHKLGLFLGDADDDSEFVTKAQDVQSVVGSQIELVKNLTGLKVAIVGMAGIFPGSDDVFGFWQNLVNEKESITFYSKEELLAEGIDPDLLDDPDYIPAHGAIRDYKGFDASFFGFSPREAQITDPQHRLYLETVYSAIEHAGYANESFSGSIGVYGGSFENMYFINHILPNPKLWNTVGSFPIMVGNERDFLCTRVCFKLGLSGPGVVVQSACTTSLLAVHVAVNALVNGECDMAVAGGVSLGKSFRSGYLHEPGMLASPDGHTKPWDEDAAGTVPGQGSAVVVLKPLEKAIEDRDTIYAVIGGSASNNDGNRERANFTAPGLEGQPEVLKKAQKIAGFQPDSIGYLEASTTASPLGDPIEIGSLTSVFREQTEQKNFCALGGVKANIGILDHASGVTALIKAALAVHHKKLPGNIHFKKANPKLKLEASPFYVNAETIEWKHDLGTPRRAGVSSFGLGGTNAHVLLEEFSKNKPAPKIRNQHLLILSAKSRTALDQMSANLSTHLKKNPSLDISDICYTLQVGRNSYSHRRMVVCHSTHQASIELEKKDPRSVLTKESAKGSKPVCFMFPGQGVQYIGMGEQLYRGELVYRRAVDRCWGIIKGLDPQLYQLLTAGSRETEKSRLHETFVTQPATFVTEYAMAKTLQSWGIQPDAMIGNSLGEFVAAHLSGVFSLEDGLKLVVHRGRLMQQIESGAQLAVMLSEGDIQDYLNEELSVAGIAGPEQSMISGSRRAINTLKENLLRKGITCYRLHTSHAFHSYMMDSIVEPFTKAVSEVVLNKPQIPFISTITGGIIKDEEATSAEYWGRQLRETVRFSSGLTYLLDTHENMTFIEVGPEKQLTTIAIRHPSKGRGHTVLPTMRQPVESGSDEFHLLTLIGRLWLNGFDIDFATMNEDRLNQRLPLPTYPFEKKTHWIDPPRVAYTAFDDDFEEDGLDDSESESEDDDYRPNVVTDYVAPRNDTEQSICSDWQEFLGLKKVGVFDDFFELGGSSLVALRLVNQLRKKFGVPLANHVLLQHRTVAALAEHIDEHQKRPEGVEAEFSALVEIQKGDSKRKPLFLIHPIGGDVYFYRELAQSLGSRQPVYAIQAQSLTGKTAPFRSIKEQATAYLAEIEKFSQKQPYWIGGSSYGGILSYEIACQLREKGKETSVLVIIDSPGPGKIDLLFQEYSEILAFMFEDHLKVTKSDLDDLTPDEQIATIHELARSANRFDLIPDGFGIPMLETWKCHQRAAHEWQAKPYEGQALYFRATEIMKKSAADLYLPWLDLVKGGLQVHQIPGDHLTMNYTPNVSAIAKHVKKAMKYSK